MNPTELQPSELMQMVANFFKSEGIHYLVVGSMASMAYFEPRFTSDVDMDRDYIAQWSRRLEVNSEWEMVLNRSK